MHEPSKRSLSEHHQPDEAAQPSAKPIPWIIRSVSRPFGLRHVKGVAVIRLLVAIWLVILGTTFCALGHWWGTLYFVGAGFVGSLAYRMPRWKRALEVEKNLQSLR